jgi:AcrR family transcriptional regulator
MSSTPHDRILSASTRLLEQEGVQAVGVNRIIAEADVAPMTLYRHFGGKDQLVAATVEQWSGQWLQWLSDRLDRCGDDPDKRLAALWDALETWLAAGNLHGSLAANVASDLRSRPQHPAHKAVAEHRRALHHLLADLAKLAGVPDPECVALQLQVLVHGAIAVAVAERQPTVLASVRALGDAALDLSA